MIAKVRVYKVTSHKDTVFFVVKQSEEGKAGSTMFVDNIKDAASKVFSDRMFLHRKMRVKKVVIDFKPEHDIECFDGGQLWFCEELSMTEKWKFWEYFKKHSN